jgi:Mlc titration factor MtfA (ptsG expression regulator)
VDQFVLPLPNGRSLTLLPEQLRRVARGLGDESLARSAGHDQQEPPIVLALRELPTAQRSDALNVVLRRFGDKQDVETIAQSSGLNPWMVWRLEESFRQALAEVQRSRPLTGQPLLAAPTG